MGNKLFIGGLPWETDDERLKSAFAEHGEVTEAKVIMDRETGRSRGFGFVTFKNAEDADTALRVMNDSDLDGRTIRVNEAVDKPRGGGGGGRGEGRRDWGEDRPPRRDGGGGRRRDDRDY